MYFMYVLCCCSLFGCNISRNVSYMDTARLQHKRASQANQGSEERDVDNNLQVQQEEDRDSSTRWSQTELSGRNWYTCSDKASIILLYHSACLPRMQLQSYVELSGGKREDYQNCSVLYYVLKLCTVISTLSLRWAVLTGLWIGFFLTGPIHCA